MDRRKIHYHIRRLPTIVVVIASVPGELEVCLVPHLVHHSPTGMEFGYAGSGPADLALSLLTFHLEADAVTVKRILTGNYESYELANPPANNPTVRVVALYQDFKQDALGGHGDDKIDLTGAEIDWWIEAREARAADHSARIGGWRKP